MPQPAEAGSGVGSAPAPETAMTAARLLTRGVNVVPIRPRDKRPAVDWKALQGSPLIERDDLDRFVFSWWDGTNYGIGAITGTVSQLAVVDVDDDEAAALLEATCELPRTVTVRTRKGRHVWFRRPAGEPRPNRTRIGGVGMDVRADGGYVVCPPSVHSSGHVYDWLVSPWEFADGVWPPAPMPPELVELIWPARVSVPTRSVEHSRPSSRYVRAALDAELAKIASASEGSRNSQLNTSAFKLARFVASGDLSAASFLEMCLEAARRVGLPTREAERTVESALRAAIA